MRIIDRIERDGAFLFRWRSYGPLVLIPVLIVALLEAADIEASVGDAWHDYWGVFCYGIAWRSAVPWWPSRRPAHRAATWPNSGPTP